MGKITVEPYLFFKGQAGEAIEFYKNIFGGKVTKQTFAEAPKDMPRMPGMKDDFVMHASLKGGSIDLMVSDSAIASSKATKVELSLGGIDEEKMRKMFNDLAKGGEVRMPLEKQFWGDLFGSVTDRYGVDWMMNIGENMA